MEEKKLKFERLIKGAPKILITSHISPDPDAVSSVLLMGLTLQDNFPEKNIRIVLEEEPLDLDFLPNYEKLEFQNLLSALKQFQPDLFILVDGNNYIRASRLESQNVREYINSNGVKTAIIDHHEPDGRDEPDVYLNPPSPASAQTVYQLLFDDFGLKKPDQAAQIAMVGFYADTGGFVYLAGKRPGEVFDFAKELVTSGADVELIKNMLSQYSQDDIRVLNELTSNLSHQDGYSYSYISDEFIDNWLKVHSQAELQKGTGLFLDEFIRNIGGRPWGFITFRNTLSGENIYSVSLRALGGTKDVSLIARTMGGGGHKPAAGAKLEAQSVEEAIQKIKAAIASQ